MSLMEHVLRKRMKKRDTGRVLKGKQRKIPVDTVCDDGTCDKCKIFLSHVENRNQARETYQKDKDTADNISKMNQGDNTVTKVTQITWF